MYITIQKSEFGPYLGHCLYRNLNHVIDLFGSKLQFSAQFFKISYSGPFLAFFYFLFFLLAIFGQFLALKLQILDHFLI